MKDKNDLKKAEFLGTLFELRNFEIFRVISKTDSTLEKVEIFKQSIRATKLCNFAGYFLDGIGLRTG